MLAGILKNTNTLAETLLRLLRDAGWDTTKNTKDPGWDTIKNS